MSKVFVLGIDGGPPQLIFERWLDDLPNIKRLLTNAKYGTMQSSTPPSTIVAWTSLLTGKDPSHFDIFSYTYKDEQNKVKLVNSQNVKAPRIWKNLDEAGKRSILMNVPLTYPVEPLNGIMISGFLSPGFNERSVYPAQVRERILQKYNQEYMFDVKVGLAGYKNLDTEQMIKGVYQMTEMQFKVMNDFLDTESWDFFMNVLIGTDRMQHTMWRLFDTSHRRYPGRNEYENAIKEYYQYIDRQIGQLIEKLDDDTYFILASDHGFDKMDGRFNLNDWLIQEGYLTLKTPVISGTPQKLDFTNIDWSRTRAYAIGAYFGRIYFNKTSRDQVRGAVEESEVISLQDEIILKLKTLRNDRGEDMVNRFFKPQEVYSGPYIQQSPDLYVYFDNLRWGVNNDVGNQGLYSEKTTKGSDDAGHAPEGLFLLYHPKIQSERLEGVKITDMFPTIMKALGVLDTQNDTRNFESEEKNLANNKEVAGRPLL